MGPFVLALAAFVAVQALRWLGGFMPPLDGSFDGADSYMRLVRVLECRGACPDGVLYRSNAPFGEVLHWPFIQDWLLLAIAFPLRLVLPFRDAVVGAGYLWGPLLSILLIAGLVRVGRLLLPRQAVWFVGPLLATQLWALTGFAPHAVDHHGFLALTFVLALAAAVPTLLGRPEFGAAVATGIALGIGMWESVEMLIAGVPLIGGLALLWILRGDPAFARYNRTLFAVATLLLLLALVVDGPEPERLAAEYDRFSLPHVVLFALATTFWAVAARLRAATAGRRAVIASAGALMVPACVIVVFPEIVRGPLAAVPTEAFATWIDPTVEFMPAVRHEPVWLALALGPLLFALLYCLVRALRSGADDRAAWGVLAFALAWFGALAAFQQIRWTYYLHSLYPVALAGLLVDLLRSLSRLRPPLAVAAARLGLVGTALAAPIVVVLLFSVTAPRHEGPCMPHEYITALRQHADDSGVVLANVFVGPEVLYRTGHDVVASPYHRNIAGTRASHDIMASTDFAEARRLIAQRRVRWIATCRGEPWYPLVQPDAPGTLHAALQRSDPPEWLVRGEPDIGRVIVWRVASP